MVSSRLDEFPKFKRLLLDLGLYAFLHLYERDQILNGEVNEEDKRKEENMLDTYRLASSFLDFSGELADCIENLHQLLLFPADCCARIVELKRVSRRTWHRCSFLLRQYESYLNINT